MKKRNFSDDEIKHVDNTKIVKVQLEEEMKTSFIAYAMAVNVSRAIPDVRDGLKPVHRRILYSMGELNLFSDKPYRKCARIVGDVLGKYHPHGDSAVYMALVRLAQDFSIRCPLVDGHGNFGSVDGDPPAAQRYTEARLSKIAGEMLRDIDKETVDWYPNFDDTLEQPTVLPARFPNLLVNGSDGIAVGMATNIPPHNLGEVINGVCALIDNPEITVDELMQYIPAPDYPTGGIIMGRANLRHAYRTGKGGVVIRAKTEIEEYPMRDGSAQMRQRIIVTELPYQVNKAELIKTIADLVKDKRIEGISDIKEESDRQGMRIVIEVKRDAQAQVVLNTLYKHTDLQTSNGITYLALVNGEPKILNLKEMLYHYVEHQKEIVLRRTRYDLEKAEERAHILEGLVKALANIDKVVAIIKASRDKVEACEKLMSEFILSDKQANAILEMRLQRLTSLEVEHLKAELAALKETIADLKNIIANPHRVEEIVKNELGEIKEKYDTPRKTELCIDYDEIDIGDLIEREDVVISMTHFGYIKRLPTTEYKAQHRGGKGVTAHRPKEEDFVENMFVTCTHDNVLFFTNLGKVYSIKAYEVPEAEKTARGRAIVNLLQLGEGEKVNAIIPIKEDMRGNLIMATKNGLIKKTALDEFASIRKVGKIAINLVDGDELISVQLTCGRDEILVASSEGKCIRFSEEDVRLMGRDTQGVKSMKLNPDDYVVDMTVVKSGCEVLTVSQLGYGKRTDLDDYRLQSRAGKGIKAGVFNKKTGRLVNLKQITPDDDVMIIADNGTIIRMRAKEISKIGRDTQGVRIMKMKQQGSVVCVAVAQPEEEEVLTDEGEATEE
ncbi:MAG: DNA gyrase subunit A [Clostridia bacterium]|jgi:DNA gyrase subunit A|uniref:DNA gyrase subunit A n=1 Tax=Pumilibacter muris TaxID=2941510 RepID=UPI0020403DFD|nr:DNA gyrase subunit A [Pumilibacter muris]MCI8596416.1 DNA gyrase subunit A [Clostridia bacterium]